MKKAGIRPSNIKLLPRKRIFGLITFSLLGYLVSFYLTLQHFRGIPPSCTIIKGCDIVYYSKYSELLNLPISLYGVLFYLTVLFMSAVSLHKPSSKLLVSIRIATVVGVLAEFILFYIQACVIKAFCIYCLLSFISSLVLFIISFSTIHYIFRRN